MLKQSKKDYPTASQWPTFTGEGEYNHLEFISWVDILANKMGMPDELITSKLMLVFKGVAKDWLLETMEDDPDMAWPQWKEAMQDRFGTDAWRDKMEQAFNKYNPLLNPDMIAWATQQKKRLKAFDPAASTRKIIENILWKTSGDIRNNVLARLSDSDKWSKFLVIIEDISKNTYNGKRISTTRNTQNLFKKSEFYKNPSSTK
ncbi:hypothetical protein CROQUDRAFT_54890, partial [Cronartium quercuum f. sp. fusiforme G11]